MNSFLTTYEWSFVVLTAIALTFVLLCWYYERKLDHVDPKRIKQHADRIIQQHLNDEAQMLLEWGIDRSPCNRYGCNNPASLTGLAAYCELHQTKACGELLGYDPSYGTAFCENRVPATQKRCNDCHTIRIAQQQ